MPAPHPQALGRGGEENHCNHQGGKKSPDEKMDRDFGQLSCLSSRGKALSDSELITNALDRLKISEGEESNSV